MSFQSFARLRESGDGYRAAQQANGNIISHLLSHFPHLIFINLGSQFFRIIDAPVRYYVGRLAFRTVCAFTSVPFLLMLFEHLGWNEGGETDLVNLVS